MAVSRAIAAYAAKGEKERAAARVLTLAYSTFVSWHSTANTYWNQRQFPRNVFVRQKINQTWDFVEANPVANSLKRWDVVANAVAADGAVVALADTAAGVVRLFAWENGRFRSLAEKKGLTTPAKLALNGDRLVVWERATQSVRRLAFSQGE